MDISSSLVRLRSMPSIILRKFWGLGQFVYDTYYATLYQRGFNEILNFGFIELLNFGLKIQLYQEGSIMIILGIFLVDKEAAIFVEKD